MKAKEYLSQYRRIEHQMDSSMEALRRFQKRLDRCTDVSKNIPNDEHDKYIKSLKGMAESAHELRASIDDLVALRHEICGVINSLPDHEQRALLEYRYLNGWSWTKIELKLCVTHATAWRIHCDALHRIGER